MARGKYIVVEIDGVEHAIVFDAALVHKHVAQCFLRLDATIVSAGFVEVDGYREDVNVQTGGHSVSLSMGSRPSDYQLIECALGLR